MKKQAEMPDVNQASECLGCQTTTLFGRAHRAAIGPTGIYDAGQVHRDFGKFQTTGTPPPYVVSYLAQPDIKAKLDSALTSA